MEREGETGEGKGRREGGGKWKERGGERGMEEEIEEKEMEGGRGGREME